MIEGEKPDYRKMAAALMAIALVAISVGMLVFLLKQERCYAPAWLALEFVDGGPALIRTSSVNSMLPLKFQGRPATKIEFTDRGFVFVNEKVSTIQRKLCMEGK